ncbi:MAG TPA: rubrerythrin family protein [Candidatus Hydrogenedentes bacterium]|nr:rubrerythrin family protein [Candidatus Hydrogenedentota bacterium]
MATSENLAAAFSGESRANRKYLAFAKKVEQDGFRQVAKLFRAAAAAETVHAHAHLRVMGGVGTAAENLEAAVAGEGHEYKEMYPKFVEEAQQEGNKAAAVTFKNALAVEEVHHGLFSEALASVRSGHDLPAAPVYVCDLCGNTVIGEAPDKCAVCGAPKARFTEVI